jgi:bla regulator protein blaR1
MSMSPIVASSFGLTAPAAFEFMSRAAAANLIAAIWQGSIVVACVWLCLRLVPRTTAAFRFAIWTTAFLVLVLFPLLRLLPQFPFATHLTAAPSIARPWLEMDSRWSLVITAIWAVASLYRAVDLAAHTGRLRNLWKTASPITQDGSPASELVAELTARVPAIRKRSIQICTTGALDRPSVIGFLSPRILIPAWLLEKLSYTELEQIVLHEAEHLRRGDDWTNLLQKLSLVLFPLNPVLIWVERRLRFEREMACDEGVIRFTRAPHAYATCLTRLAESSLAHRVEALSLGIANWTRRSELVLRVQSILLRKRSLSPLGASGLWTTLVVGMILGAVTLSQTPQLVEFAPHQETTQAQANSEPNHPINHPLNPPAPAAKASLIDASYHPRPAQSTNLHPVATNCVYRPCVYWPHLTQLRATMPVQADPAQPGATRSVQTKFNPDLSRPGKLHQRRQDLSPAPTTQIEMLKAEISPAEESPEQDQGFIVLRAWEQSSDIEPASMDATRGRPGLTPVVFHVVSPGHSFQTFAAVPTRTGWLVIQL